MINNFNKNNSAKIKFLLDIWYQENFTKAYIGKLNLDINDIIEESKPARISDYQEEARKKQTKKISDIEIRLTKEQESLQIVFWGNTGCFDLSNFQSGALDDSYRDDLKKDIQNFRKKDGKIVVFMPGNIIGKEWEFKHLINATSNLTQDDLTDEKVIRRLFFGLKKRKQKIINDIKAALSYGAEEVYLMKGDEEFKVLKVTGVDVLADIIEQLNDPRVKYISEGTETKLNLIKETASGEEIYNIIKLKTNYATKSENPTVSEKERPGKFEETSDVTFCCNANYTSAIKNDNIYYPSGQLTFFNAMKGRNPKSMVNDGNLFRLYPEGHHDLTVVKGGQNIYEANSKIINDMYKLQKYNIAKADYAIEQIEEMKNNLLTQKNVVVKQTRNRTKTTSKEDIKE